MDKRQKDQPWNPIEPGNPRKDVLVDWIAEYFTGGVRLDLTKFRRRDNTLGNGIELTNPAGTEGFVFVNDVIDEKYESRMETVKRMYQNSGREVLRKFTDYLHGLAGFDWRRVR